MKNIRLVLNYLVFPIILGFILVFFFWYYAVLYQGGKFHAYSYYQSLIQDKYEQLCATDSPKIIIIGGSNACFGIDEYELEAEFGYPVVNLGLHAGFGAFYLTEMAKEYIRKGDIVLLAYEYGWNGAGFFDSIGVDLLMTGIDNKIEMYRFVPVRKWMEIVGYLPEFCDSKASASEQEGVYSRKAFDENVRMIWGRNFMMKDYEIRPGQYGGAVNLGNAEISEESRKYLTELKDYTAGCGADIFFISPPLYEKGKASEDSIFIKLRENEMKMIGIPYISDPLDYIFQDEYMYDTIYHCSSAGESKRTELLITDLKNAGIENKR